MIKHILKLMWNKKTKHIFFFIEILIIFLVVTMTTMFTSELLKKYYVDLGYETERQYVIEADFGSIKDSLNIVETKDRIMQEIKQNPNIESATWMSGSYPLSGSTWGTSIDAVDVSFHSLFVVSDIDIDKTFEFDFIKGRAFVEDDYHSKYISIIVNSLFYDEFVKVRGEFLDSIIRFDYYGDMKIIGVLDHYKQTGQFDIEKPYFIALNHPNMIIDIPYIPDNLIVKTIQNSSAGFQSEISDIYSNEPALGDVYISNFEETRIWTNSPYWAQLVLIGIVSLFLLINVSLGLIGILSFTINQRKGEIGLRKVMGATTMSIVKQFVGEVMLVAGIAIFLGMLLIVQLPFIIDLEIEKMVLYQAAGVSMLFIIILLFLSSIIPSLKGARMEPSVALHEEG